MRNSMSIMDYYNNNSDRNTDNDKTKDLMLYSRSA